MHAAIMGDIVGSRFEFNPIKTKEFEFFHKDCRITDDTVMTIATADWILNYDSDPTILANVYKLWGRNYIMAGYGKQFKAWLQSDDNRPYGSWGNGSAMRVNPIGWAFDNYDDVLNYASLAAGVTHNHPEGIKGAQAVATCIWMARRGPYEKIDIKKAIERNFGYDLSRTLDSIRPGYKFDVSCQGSVPEAIICFLESNSVRDAICNAISLGGDCDTQACIAASIAQAYCWGNKDYNDASTEVKITLTMDAYMPQEMIDIVCQFSEKYMGYTKE